MKSTQRFGLSLTKDRGGGERVGERVGEGVKGKEQGKVKQTLFFSRERRIVIFQCNVMLFGNKLYINPSTMFDLDLFVN